MQRIPKILVIGDTLKSHQLIYKKQTDAVGRFNSDQELIEAIHLAGSFTAETILNCCGQLSEDKYSVNGPYSRLRKSRSKKNIVKLVREAFDSAPATDAYVCGECDYKVNDHKQRKVWRAVQDLGINIKEDRTAETANDRVGKQEGGEYPVCFVDVSWYGFGREQDVSTEIKKYIREPAHTFYIFKCKNRGYKRTINKTQKYGGDEGIDSDTNPDEIDANLCKFLKEHNSQCLVIISIEELRQAGYFISHKISWERTLQNLLHVLHIPHDNLISGYRYLSRANHIVVTCGSDAAVYFCRQNSTPPQGFNEVSVKQSFRLYFAPEGIEGDVLRRFPHRMRGFDTLIGCSIAHHLIQCRVKTASKFMNGAKINPSLSGQSFESDFESDLDKGILIGLKAARFLQSHGFDFVDRSDGNKESSFLDDKEYVEHKWFKTAEEAFNQYNHEGSYGHKVYYYYPYDLVSNIIVKGNVARFSWFPVKQGDENRREYLRKQGQRIQDEWVDSGWILKHDFQSEFLRNLIEKNNELAEIDAYQQQFPRIHVYSSDASYFDKNWWTLYRSSIADFYSIRSELAEAVSKELALQVLKNGAHWLTKKMELDDEREVVLKRVMKKHDLNGEKCEFRAFPVARIGDLWLIGRKEMEAYRNVSAIISQFLSRDDNSPVNIGVFGSPGAGKSFGIKELLKSIETTEIHFRNYVFNLSQFNNPNLLVDAFDEIQEAGLLGQIPVVFWDEYDSDLDQPFGWLKYFIGPMQDGEYFRNGKTCRLPKSIFVFAGSRFTEYNLLRVIEDEIRTAQDLVDPVAKHWRDAKGIDFKSRLVGVIDIPDVNFTTSTSSIPNDVKSMTAYFRRAIVIRSLLLKCYPDLFNNSKELQISDKVAAAFISVPYYYHGARSIEKILNMCSLKGMRYFDVSCLPAASQLRLHVPIQDFERYYLPGHPLV